MEQTFYVAKCNETQEYKPFWFVTVKDEAGEYRKEKYEKETNDDTTVVEVKFIEV